MWKGGDKGGDKRECVRERGGKGEREGVRSRAIDTT